MTAARTALIAGAGIAGPVMAMALQKAGIEATVLEARPGPEADGAFLTVASNGIAALRVIGAGDAVLDAGFPTSSITLRSGSGRRLGESPTGGTLEDGTTSHTLRREDLRRALHDEAVARGIGIEHGRRVEGFEEGPDGVRVGLAGGEERTADVLIGCDGVHSAVRRAIDPGAPAPAYAGLLNAWGWAGGVEAVAAPGTYEMVFGRRAFFGHVQDPAGAVWWFANVPQAREPGRGALAAVSGDGRREQLAALFARDAGPAAALVAATATIPPMTPVHVMPPLPRWHRGRAIVVGDAAHAPSPSSGQGASLAVEDALVLALALRDAPGVPAAFATYEAARRPRVERIARRAARTNSSKAAGPVGRVVRDAMLPVVLRLTADGKAAREVWEHRIAWERAALPVA